MVAQQYLFGDVLKHNYELLVGIRYKRTCQHVFFGSFKRVCCNFVDTNMYLISTTLFTRFIYQANIICSEVTHFVIKQRSHVVYDMYYIWTWLILS